MKLGLYGELLPQRGFSRWPNQFPPPRSSTWRTHDGLVVCSGQTDLELPGSGGLFGPTWAVSVSAGDPFSPTLGPKRRVVARRRPTNAELARVIDAFAMPAFEEDNHLPGVIRMLFCPIAVEWRGQCECKLTETQVVEPDGFVWSNDVDPAKCRGCEMVATKRRLGVDTDPCPLHPEGAIA